MKFRWPDPFEVMTYLVGVLLAIWVLGSFAKEIIGDLMK